MKANKHNTNSDLCRAALSSAFGIAAETESGDINPQIVCHCCYLTLRQIKTARDKGRYRETNLVPLTWLPHGDPCTVCHDASTTARGRPRKIKAKGRPRDDDLDHQSRKIVHHLSTLRTHKFSDYALDNTCFLTSPHLQHLSCQLCLTIPNEPLQILSCQHILCMSCIRSGCEKEAPIVCPCSSIPIRTDCIAIPSPFIIDILGSLLICCGEGCGQILELKHYQQHRNSKCSSTPVPPPSMVTVQQLLDLQEGGSTSTLRSQTTSLLLQKIVPSNGPVQCKSASGQVCT